jgi:hypothetical protein
VADQIDEKRPPQIVPDPLVRQQFPSTRSQTDLTAGSYTQPRKTGVTSILIWTSFTRATNVVTQFSPRGLLAWTRAPGSPFSTRAAIRRIAASISASDVARSATGK